MVCCNRLRILDSIVVRFSCHHLFISSYIPIVVLTDRIVNGPKSTGFTAQFNARGFWSFKETLWFLPKSYCETMNRICIKVNLHDYRKRFGINSPRSFNTASTIAEIRKRDITVSRFFMCSFPMFMDNFVIGFFLWSKQFTEIAYYL